MKCLHMVETSKITQVINSKSVFLRVTAANIGHQHRPFSPNLCQLTVGTVECPVDSTLQRLDMPVTPRCRSKKGSNFSPADICFWYIVLTSYLLLTYSSCKRRTHTYIWPTPAERDGKTHTYIWPTPAERDGRTHTYIWPTPAERDGKTHTYIWPTPTVRDGRTHTYIWPTPAVRDGRTHTYIWPTPA